MNLGRIIKLNHKNGKGALSNKHKGGKVVVKVDEPSYLIGIVSLTPRIDYSQGNNWHSSASEAFKRGAHAEKAALCHKAGISLLAVYEDEWKDENKRDLIKAMIKHRLKVSDAKKLNARDLSVEAVKPKTLKPFFEKFHLDGHKQSSEALVLKHGDTVVMAIMMRRNMQGDMEISRMASDYNYIVRGGFQKLLSKLSGKIVSYSNNRLSSGDVYQKSGFIEITETKAPSYWYTDLVKRVWRAKCMRDNSKEILSQYPTEEIQAANGVFSKQFGHNRSGLS